MSVDEISYQIENVYIFVEMSSKTIFHIRNDNTKHDIF